MGNIGPGEILLLALIAIVLFGPKRLPEIGRSFGTTLREFRHAITTTPSGESPDAITATRAEETPDTDSGR